MKPPKMASLSNSNKDSIAQALIHAGFSPVDTRRIMTIFKQELLTQLGSGKVVNLAGVIYLQLTTENAYDSDSEDLEENYRFSIEVKSHLSTQLRRAVYANLPNFPAALKEADTANILLPLI